MSVTGARRGLTLVELLAAAVILSAMAAAAVSVQRDALHAAQRARLQSRALAAFEEWRATTSARQGTPEESEPGWRWLDDHGTEWRVRREFDSGGGLSYVEPPDPDRPLAGLAWEAVMVEMTDEDGGAPIEALRVRRPVDIATSGPRS